jgi:putative phosphoribosyl transferase
MFERPAAGETIPPALAWQTGCAKGVGVVRRMVSMGTAMPFRDRADAGKKLAAALKEFAGQDAVVLALPRGGVPVAAEVAARLHAPLDLVLVRKIGAPIQPELAMGAVVDGAAPIIVRNEDVILAAMIGEADFNRICALELAEIVRRRRRYLGERPRVEVKGRVVIVVDDGIATGATMKAALRATRMRGPKKLILATPVAASDTLRALQGEADQVICLEDYEDLCAIGLYYADFSQTSDEEVIEALSRFPPAASTDKQGAAP